ncbi:MAG: N-acetyl-gamma-glutamyl-phosphate reductase [Spirochaetaceae bacterium]|nr:N-acetyl-gamma-glutamyl-phosphate reductase [Spirochaetaceae bacterium]
MTIGIIGATGYAGAELIRLLLGHPEAGTLILASSSHAGERIEDIYPNLRCRVSAVLVSPEAAIAKSDCVFAALPSGVGEPYAGAALKRGIPYIDLSADFRFDDDEGVYSAWYGKPYADPGLREHSVYGLPELNRRRIQELASKGPVIIGNPGCYPTGASLASYPGLAKGLAGEGAIIVDAASGVTGGGRELSRAFHFPECSEALSPYKVGAHRHIPEISRNLSKMAGRPVRLVFTPHLAPMNRGILSTVYIPLAALTAPPGGNSTDLPPSKEILQRADEIRELYAAFYQDEPFVRVLPSGATASTRGVRQSNYCDISVHLDQTGSTLIVVSAIDNMVKGAAGQALQNMNIIFGFDERLGLGAAPAAF